MTTTKKLIWAGIIAVGLPALVPAAAYGNEGYWVDSKVTIVKNGTGGCWHTIFWTPAMAVSGCDAVEEKPVAAPTPVAKSASAPQPKESWKTVVTEKPVRLEGANFATNSAKLLKTADVKLNEVVNAAKQYPEVKLEVSGHTDNRGKKTLNQKLSENRAAAVKAWLVKHGVAADRITTAGYADTQPIADNKTKVGRAANRRVEVNYVIQEEKKVSVTE